MIAPARQRQGLGLLLLEHSKRHLTTHGGGTLVLDCWAGNTKLRAFYQGAGFALHRESAVEAGDVAVFTWQSPV